MAKLLLLLYNAVFIAAEIVGQYSIPEPDIIAFQGGGLRVTIKNEPGISMFRFHANINDAMKQLYPGTVNIETSTPVNGMWVLEDRSVRVKVGDTIFYWIFIEKDHLGYVKQPVQFVIQELFSYDDVAYQTAVPATRSTSPYRTTTFRTPITERDYPSTSATAPSTVPATNILSSLQNQIDALKQKVDIISSIAALQAQVHALNKKVDAINNSPTLQSEAKDVSKAVEHIISTLDTLPEAKKLTLSGAVPPNIDNKDLNQVVRSVILERLDLRVNVSKAIRNKDGSISFELKTLQEKLVVLKAAEEKLNGSWITFT